MQTLANGVQLSEVCANGARRWCVPDGMGSASVSIREEKVTMHAIDWEKALFEDCLVSRGIREMKICSSHGHK